MYSDQVCRRGFLFSLFSLVALLLCQLVVPALAQSSGVPAYKLGVGDKVRVTVYNEKDLSGDFDVSDQGRLSLPLIGDVAVAGKTTSEVQKIITDKYGANYLVNPRVGVDVLNYRPFFILGEVQKPGSYPYVNSMTVLNAVALAGGYTPRADRDKISITRAGTGKEVHIGEEGPVLPGDVIRVEERLF